MEDKQVVYYVYKYVSRLQRFCKYKLVITINSSIMEISWGWLPLKWFFFWKVFQKSPLRRQNSSVIFVLSLSKSFEVRKLDLVLIYVICSMLEPHLGHWFSHQNLIFDICALTRLIELVRKTLIFVFFTLFFLPFCPISPKPFRTYPIVAFYVYFYAFFLKLLIFNHAHFIFGCYKHPHGTNTCTHMVHKANIFESSAIKLRPSKIAWKWLWCHMLALKIIY